MIKKKVILITGTSRGIGRHLAEHYAALGWVVVGCSRGNSDLSNQGYFHYTVDITDEPQVIDFIRSVYRKFKRIDALINNAGTAKMNHALLTPTTTVDHILNLNLKATILFSKEVAKIMIKKKYGRIINISSVAVSMALAGEAVYAASKAAVETYSRVIARELAAMNITVNIIAPPPIKTDLIKGVSPEAMQTLFDRLVIPEYGTFDDVANISDFFLNDRSGKITGQLMTIGGW